MFSDPPGWLMLAASMLTLGAAVLGIWLFVDQQTQKRQRDDREFVRKVTLERVKTRTATYEQGRVRLSDILTETTALLPAVRGYDDTIVIKKVTDDNRRCPDCEGTRCRPWRDSEHTKGCGNQASPGNSYVSLEESVTSPGAHTVAGSLKRWVDVAWTPLSVETRVFIAPHVWARRLPVPVR